LQTWTKEMELLREETTVEINALQELSIHYIVTHEVNDQDSVGIRRAL